MQRQLTSVRGSLMFLAMCACCACWGTDASAQAAINVSGSIGATSDFVFRGLSYTRGGPAIQASIDLEHASGLYGGLFASSTNPNPGRSPAAEVDAWLGYGRNLSDALSLDLRYLHYAYPDDPRLVEYDRDEFTAALGWRGIVFLAATYSPNTDAIASTPGFGEGDAGTLELSFRHQLSTRWSISAGVGRYYLSDIYDADYDFWGVTLSADLTPFELHLAALGADDTAERIFTSRVADERFAATVLYRFTWSR